MRESRVGILNGQAGEIEKLPDKTCYLVCSIIILLNTSLVGVVIYFIDNEGLEGSMS